MIKTAIKTTILFGLMGTSFYYGEKLKPVENLTTKLRYYRVEAEKGTPKDYLDWTTKITIENDKATLYFGNHKTDTWRKVHENGMVGSFGEKVDEYLEEKKNSIKQYWHESENFKNLKETIDYVGENIGRSLFELFNN